MSRYQFIWYFWSWDYILQDFFDKKNNNALKKTGQAMARISVPSELISELCNRIVSIIHNENTINIK